MIISSFIAPVRCVLVVGRKNIGMPLPKTYFIAKELPFSCEQVFSIVNGTDDYPLFVPWCVGIKELDCCDGEEGYRSIEMSAGFKNLNAKFVSKVRSVENEYLTSEEKPSSSSLFKSFTSKWTFYPTEGGTGCRVEFEIEFEFKLYIFAYITSLFWGEISKSILKAFIKRCYKVYGSGDNDKNITTTAIVVNEES